jgi:hypothetical protein
MSSKELMDKYPTEQILFVKRNDDQSLKGGTVMYPILANKFWDTLGVVVAKEKVEGLSYCRVNREMMLSQDIDEIDYSNVIENIKPLFIQLRKELGAEFEKKVIWRPWKDSKVRSAIYMWKREKDVVIFLHTPIALYKKEEAFDCQLTITPTLGNSLLSEIATDSLPEDKLLWAEAMGEETVSLPKTNAVQAATAETVQPPAGTAKATPNRVPKATAQSPTEPDNPAEPKTTPWKIPLLVGILAVLGATAAWRSFGKRRTQ